MKMSDVHAALDYFQRVDPLALALAVIVCQVLLMAVWFALRGRPVPPHLAEPLGEGPHDQTKEPAPAPRSVHGAYWLFTNDRF